jgi:outer membrane receptor protein involved in Fe transport
MDATTLELSETIEIIAERPLVEKNFTHSYSAITSDQIENIAVRGMDDILSLQAGVVVQDGNVYIRGGRSDQTGYFLDGSSITSPFDNTRYFTIIQNAVEELQVLTGGYPAEYGGAISGIVLTELKTGKPELNFSLELQTDNFVDDGEKFLDTYSYGHTIITGTVSAPIFTPRVRLFAALENEYIGDWRKRWSEGFKFTNLVDTRGSSKTYGDTIPVLEYPDGATPYNSRDTWRVNGTLLLDFYPVQVKLMGAYNFERSQNNTYPMLNILNSREGWWDTNDILAGIKVTHIVNNKTFYDVKFNYYHDQAYRMDSYFGRDWRAWHDSARVAQHTNGNVVYRGRWDPGSWMDLAGFPFAHDGDPRYDSYIEEQFSYISGNFALTSQFNRYNELKIGLEFSYHTIRRYGIYPDTFMQLVERYGGEENIPASEFPQYWVNRGITIGYDFFGNEIEDDIIVSEDGQQITTAQAPAHPVVGAFYIQDKLEFGDLIINAGLRFDYIDVDSKYLINPTNPPVTQTFESIADSGWADKEPVMQFSPRLGMSFPISERTVFYAQYGKFMQMPTFDSMYGNRFYYGNNILYGFNSWAGADLDMIRTTQYEIGFRQQFSNFGAFSIVGYYKNIKNQLDRHLIEADVVSEIKSYLAWHNADFTTTRGFDLEFVLRRISRVQLRLNYTLSSAEGSSSDRWAVDTKNAFPLDYDRRHSGSLILDYRFANNDGGVILQNSGVNFIFRFSSGHPYTQYDPLPGSSANGYNGVFSLNSRGQAAPEHVNASTTPWTYSLDMRLDKSIRIWDRLSANIFIRVVNLLNTRNSINVYRTTGSAYDDGWLANSDNSSEFINRYGQTYIDMYRAINLKNGQSYLDWTGTELFNHPRQIWLGLKFTY